MSDNTIEPAYAEIGRRIKEARRQRGISQGALAAAMGLARTSIVMIERGQQRILVHTLFDFARVLGVSAPSLLDQPSNIPADRAETADIEAQIRKSRAAVREFIIESLADVRNSR